MTTLRRFTLVAAVAAAVTAVACTAGNPAGADRAPAEAAFGKSAPPPPPDATVDDTTSTDTGNGGYTTVGGRSDRDTTPEQGN